MGDVTPSAIGTGVLAMRTFFEKALGKHVVMEALASMSREGREAIELAGPLSWVPLEHVGGFNDAVARAARIDPDPLFERAVRHSTEQNFATVWRVLLRFTTDEALIARTPTMYARARNVGKLEVRSVGKGVAKIELRDFPSVTERNVRGLGISIETVMRMAGRKNARMVGKRVRGGADYDVTWDP